MLFLAIYKPNSPSEADDMRTLKLFTNWTPPFEFKGHWARGDGRGGVGLIEADSAEQVLEGIAPWAAFFDFDVTPAVEIEKAIPLFAKANEWRDSVK
jgi:Domain of unknown function (DUF3303)